MILFSHPAIVAMPCSHFPLLNLNFASLEKEDYVNIMKVQEGKLWSRQHHINTQ